MMKISAKSGALRPATTFWRAEEYHQKYSVKNPIRYAYYRKSCGRDARVAKVWAKAIKH